MGNKGRVLPELISGPRAGLAWVVKECQAMQSMVKLAEREQGIQVPARTLRQDWLVQQHELTHVADLPNMWPAPKDKHARRFFRMLCEVVVESVSLHRNGVDIRQARDHLNWKDYPLPDADDVTAWAQLWLQFTMSADASEHPAVAMMYRRACDVLGSERVAWLCQARDAVVIDTSRRTRLAWADWLAKCFPRHADTPPPPQPESGKGSGKAEEKEDSSESGESGGKGSEQGEQPTAAEPPNETEDSQEESEQDGSEESESDGSEPGDDSGEPSGKQDGTSGDAGEPGEPGDDGSDDGGEPAGSDDSGVETTTEDDDDWATPSEQVAERAGAGRLRAGQEAVKEAAEKLAEQKRAIDAAWNPDAEHGVWVINGAKLDIHRHTATRAARKVQGKGGVKASDSGSRLSFPRRLYQDGRVLARTGRAGGGILVDGSGSMAWNQAKVDRAVLILPGLWVGWYSLHTAAYETSQKTHGAYRLPTGAADYEKLRREAPYWARLCIIAEKGRVAEYKPSLETAYHSGGNEVDGDCLAYFARCVQGPKVWVSDGQVYGAPGHAKECARVMRQHNIVRVDTVDDAVAYLEGKTVLGYRDCTAKQHRLVKG